MFVVIYRWRLEPGREDDFRGAWARNTVRIRQVCGSGGSALFRAEDGTFVGIARWPDRAARDRCSERRDFDEAAFALMRDCVAERFPEQALDAVEDLWAPFPLRGDERSH